MIEAAVLEGLPAGIELMVGAVVLPFLRGHLRSAFMLLLPVLGLFRLLEAEHGLYGQVELFDFTLVLFRVDALSLIFGYIFYLAAFLGIVYSLHVRDLVQQMATLVYAAAAIAAVFAGDLVTLFVLWELTAIASVFLIWARRTERAYRAGMRYLIIQVGSGVILLAGIAILVGSGGSIAFDFIGIDSLGGKLILLAFGIKAAFPLLHNWLQ
ncbi:MAG: proton-conducting transporter membrane subunit, partial [Geobacter sp.]